jgi:hypothetical protein
MPNAEAKGARSVLKRKTVEEKEAKRLEKEAAQAKADQEKKAKERERLRRAFLETPVGQARTAFEEGDEVFQASFDVVSQEAIIVVMVGSATKKKANDPTAILNAICREGWELVNGSFVFVEEGQQSRDKFMTSGQNVATKGRTLGYYLFKRCEPNKRDSEPMPWETPELAEEPQATRNTPA